MSKDELDGLVIYASPDPSIKWRPEDFGFVKPENTPSPKPLWYFKDFELREFDNHYFLCRRKVKNDRGNTEMLHRFWIKITPEDVEFAKLLFTKGLM